MWQMQTNSAGGAAGQGLPWWGAMCQMSGYPLWDGQHAGWEWEGQGREEGSDGQCTADRPGMVKGSSADQNPTFSTNPGDLSGATWKGKSRPLFPTMTRSWQNLVLWPKSVARPTDEVCWNGCLFWPPWEVAEEWGTWATLITRKASLLRTAAKPKKAKKFIPLYVLMPPSSTPNIYVYP